MVIIINSFEGEMSFLKIWEMVHPFIKLLMMMGKPIGDIEAEPATG